MIYGHTISPRAVLASLFLFLAFTWLPAQSRSGDDTLLDKETPLSPRRLFITTLAAQSLAEQTKSIAKFLVIELITKTQIIPVLSEPEADVAMEIQAVAEAGKFRITVKATDKTSGLTAFTKTFTGDSMKIERLIPFIVEIATACATSFPPVPQRVVEVVTERVVEETETVTTAQGVWLTIRAPKGTKLELQGRKPVKVDASGEYKLELTQNTSFSYRASLTGFMPLDHVVFIEKKNIDDEVAFLPLPRLELGLSLHYLNMVPAFGASYFIVPGYFYASESLETSFLAFIQSSGSDESYSKTPDFYYLENRLGMGIRLGAPDNKLRTALNLELINRVEFNTGIFRLASWSPLGFGAGAEGLLRLPGGYYLQLASSLRLQIVGSQVYAVESTSPISTLVTMPTGFYIGSTWFLSAPDIALGVRKEL